MSSSLPTLLVLTLVGFIAQLVDGSLGMGYGVFSTTLLVAAGLMPAIASASVHTAEVVTTLVSGISHHSLGNVDWKLALPLSISGIIGGVAGAVLLSNLPGSQIKPVVSAILILMGILVVWRFAVKYREDARAEADPPAVAEVAGAKAEKILPTWKIVLVGLIAAAFDAFGGGGWGPITTPTLILTHNVQPHRVVGSVNASEFFVTLAIFITFLISLGAEQFDWIVVACLLVGGVIAAPLAAWLCKKIPQRWLGILIGLLLIATNLRTLILSLK
jgi:uncharacterized membrane protein YfcA